MEIHQFLLERLSPEEKMRYEDLFVINKETKDTFNKFRKDYNKLKYSVKRLENKYGETKDYNHNEKDNTKRFVVGMIFKIENKYNHIEQYVWLYKQRQKYFTKLVGPFQFDKTKSTHSKLLMLENCISNIVRDTNSACGNLRIANKYLNQIIEYIGRQPR